MSTLYVSVRRLATGRGGMTIGLWGSPGDPVWDDVPFDVPDKSGLSFAVARRAVKRAIADENAIPYAQLRIVGVF
jgi:hypothetical protein